MYLLKARRGYQSRECLTLFEISSFRQWSECTLIDCPNVNFLASPISTAVAARAQIQSAHSQTVFSVLTNRLLLERKVPFFVPVYYSIVTFRGLYRMKSYMESGTERARAFRRASSSLWKEACIAVVGSRDSFKEPLEALYMGWTTSAKLGVQRQKKLAKPKKG